VKHKSLWQRALHIAEETPESRNRYVDFLRALSILAVVVGHWVISAPYYTNGAPTLPHVLDVSPWTHWLTWLFQVMPIFFFVGGYSNLTAWEAAVRRGDTYAKWLTARLQRLFYPVLPLIIVWATFALLGRLLGFPPSYIQTASQIAIVPTWFLAVYGVVVLFVPLTYSAWKRFGLLSLVPLVLGAMIIDWGFFTGGWQAIAWINYLLIWFAIHQAGYAWRTGLLAKPGQMLALFPLGLILLYGLVTFGPYPLSLVGVPGDVVSNTLPPKVPLLLLALAQIGLCMSLEPFINSLLSKKRVWAVVVLINGMIMTIFLWHSTAMMLVIGAVFLIEPNFFSIYPGEGVWWIYRPLWLLVYAFLMFPFLMLFSKYEHPRLIASPPHLASLFAGCLCTSMGIAYLAQNGFGGGIHWLTDVIAIALVVSGTILVGAVRLSRPPPQI